MRRERAWTTRQGGNRAREGRARHAGRLAGIYAVREASQFQDGHQAVVQGWGLYMSIWIWVGPLHSYINGGGHLYRYMVGGGTSIYINVGY